MEAEARLVRWGGWASIGTVALVVLGIAAYAAMGELPDLDDTSAMLTVVSENQALGIAAMWLLAGSGALLIVAALGFHTVLKEATHPVTVGTAFSIAGAVVWFIFASHFVALNDLASTYADAPAATRPAIEAAAGSIFAQTDFLDIGADVLPAIGLGIFALASLQLRSVARWLCWLAVIGAVVWGVGSLARYIPGFLMASYAMQGIGFIAIFPWMLGMGVAMVRGRVVPAPTASTAA